MAKLSDISKIIEDAFNSQEITEAIGKAASRAIVTRTRTGRGVSANLETSKPLPRLKENTKRVRRYLKKKGELTGPGATPGKSALNRSGKLLESVNYVAKPGEVVISVSASQAKKVEYLININSDYRFMNLSKAEFNRAVKAASGVLKSILSRLTFNNL